MRLDKFLCDNNIGTRSQVKEYIKKGQVAINGQMVKKPETKVNEDTDIVICQGKEIHYQKYVYYMLNKPEGVVSATNDNTAPTVVSLLAVPEQKELFPVGRLDKNSRGLLLMTNQGDLVNQIMRSRYHHEKEYIVRVDRPIDATFVERMAAGVYLSELKVTTRPCKVEKLSKFTFRIILTQGLNRQIRRMCMECGYHVRDLERVRIMNLTLDGIAEGQYRPITAAEFAELQKLLRG